MEICYGKNMSINDILGLRKSDDLNMFVIIYITSVHNLYGYSGISQQTVRMIYKYVLIREALLKRILMKTKDVPFLSISTIHFAKLDIPIIVEWWSTRDLLSKIYHFPYQ